MSALSCFTACGSDDDDSASWADVSVNSSNLTSDGYFDGLLYYKISSKTTHEVTLNKVETSAVTVEIPSIVNIDGINYELTCIGENAFAGCSNLTSVSIPPSVKECRNDAFSDCYKMASANITDLTAWCKIDFYDIDSNPLYRSGKLYVNGKELAGDITIPDGITSIKSYTFQNCNNITSVTIPEGVTSIGTDAFYGCYSLTTVNIPKSVTSIGSAAFHFCNSLDALNITDLAAWCNIKFENNPLYTAGRLFVNGQQLTGDLVIPDGVTSIGDWAFRGLRDVTSLTVPDGVTHIGQAAFQDCKDLTSAVISDGVTNIGAYAFMSCKNLMSVTISENIDSIGLYAFRDCRNLKLINCKSLTPPAIYYDVFDGDTYYNATLYIPKGSLAAYRATYAWQCFGNRMVEL